jgi:hypothetical protein
VQRPDEAKVGEKGSAAFFELSPEKTQKLLEEAGKKTP